MLAAPMADTRLTRTLLILMLVAALATAPLFLFAEGEGGAACRASSPRTAWRRSCAPPCWEHAIQEVMSRLTNLFECPVFLLFLFYHTPSTQLYYYILISFSFIYITFHFIISSILHSYLFSSSLNSPSF
jgi:hypothetical protein